MNNECVYVLRIRVICIEYNNSVLHIIFVSTVVPTCFYVDFIRLRINDSEYSSISNICTCNRISYENVYTKQHIQFRPKHIISEKLP